MTRDILLAFALLAGYCLLVLASPHGRCLRCMGCGRTKRLIQVKGKSRTRKCRHCRGTGTGRRPGATAVHRLYWLVLGNRLTDQHPAAQQDERTEP